MNRERHRDRAERSSNRATGSSQPRNDNSLEVADGVDEAPYSSEDMEQLSGGDGVTSSNGDAHSLIGDNGNGSGGHSDVDATGTTLVVAKRRRRMSAATPAHEVAIAREEATVIAPMRPASAPTKSIPPVVMPPAPPPLPLPAKAQRKTPPAPIAQAGAVALPAETVAVEQPASWRFRVSLESLLWLSFLALTFFTRFWDLSNRGIHHDESLHATYSNYLYIGNGYTHDPMMHGPLQFHLIAFMYWLFGPNEATARFASAFSGVFVVMAPFFLRRQMGKVAALLATLFLFISPTILYFSRMAREDSIYSATEMLMIVGLWRFLSTRRPADFYIFAAGLSLMFTIKETAYLTVAVLGLLFLLLFVVQSGYAIVGALGGYAVAMGGWLLYIKANTQVLDATGKVISGTIPKLPDIPDTSPTYDKISAFAQAFLTHPLVVGATVLTLLFIASVILLFRMQSKRLAEAPAVTFRRARSRVVPNGAAGVERRVIRTNGRENGAAAASERTVISPVAGSTAEESAPDEQEAYDPEAASELWDPRRLDPRPGTLLARYQPGSVPHLIGALFSRPSVLLIGFIIAATIFTTLYTVFFTDMPRGLASGLFASLGYWMAQQGVARGEQPWYYYFLILPLYEPIAIFFSLAATIFFSWKGVRWVMRRRADNRYVETPTHLGAFNVDRPVPFAGFRALMPLFLITWLAGAVFLYSWAGEKMPWLTIHMTRPADLLAALFIGMLITSLATRRRERMLLAAASPDDVSTPVEREERVVPSNGSRTPRGSVTRNRRSATSARVAATPIITRKQEPPWVSWSRPGSHLPALLFLTLFVVLAFCYILTLNVFMNRAKTPEGYANWGLSWFWPVLMLALAVAYALWLGPGRALRYFGLGILSVFLIYQVRSALMLSYFQPDVPKEMAVYVQTSPDVTRTMKELNDFSTATTGGKNVKVLYDSFASWPFSWYLRDYKNAQFVGDTVPKPAADVPVMILDYSKSNNNADLLKDYTVQRYAMRWWFPEEWYKNDLMSGLPAGQDYKTAPILTSARVLITKLGDTFTKPDNQATLWNYIMFRETPKPLGSSDMNVFIRKDVAQLYHFLQYKPMPGDDLPLAYQDLPAPAESQLPTPDTSLR